MHFIIGFAILVIIFALFTRTAVLFACIAGGLGALGLLIAFIAQLSH